MTITPQVAPMVNQAFDTSKFIFFLEHPNVTFWHLHFSNLLAHSHVNQVFIDLCVICSWLNQFDCPTGDHYFMGFFNIDNAAIRIIPCRRDIFLMRMHKAMDD